MSDEQAEKERIQRILDQRIKSQYGGTAGKLKYNTGLKSKHKMTRNTKAMPGWRDLPLSFKSTLFGGILGLVAWVFVYYLALSAFEQRLLALLLGVLAFVILAVIGFILGKAMEQ